MPIQQMQKSFYEVHLFDFENKDFWQSSKYWYSESSGTGFALALGSVFPQIVFKLRMQIFTSNAIIFKGICDPRLSFDVFEQCGRAAGAQAPEWVESGVFVLVRGGQRL